MIETRTRLMASEAYQCVIRHQGERGEKDYRSLALALPATILQNGLAQATGFLVAKDKPEHPEHKALLDDLSAVLSAAKVVHTADGKRLHQDIIRCEAPQRWMQLTRHSLEASAWIKRYAQGLLKSGRDEGTSDEAEEGDS